ncbi:MAG TPA: SAM-dependent methyltransferase, partial [Candidatus Dormibacteraeota bacterium]|nr:SAM-dependent methyltransferase [Candidatus Dormibacteraeota bacterium]
MTAPGSDRWSSGSAYESYIGRWSRLVAPIFLDWLAIPRGRRWLDAGSGTGALTEAILARGEPSSVVGV